MLEHHFLHHFGHDGYSGNGSIVAEADWVLHSARKQRHYKHCQDMTGYILAGMNKKTEP